MAGDWIETAEPGPYPNPRNGQSREVVTVNRSFENALKAQYLGTEWLGL